METKEKVGSKISRELPLVDGRTAGLVEDLYQVGQVLYLTAQPVAYVFATDAIR